MRLGTKILLLILAVTLGLSGLVIGLITRDIPQSERQGALSQIKREVRAYEDNLRNLHHLDTSIINIFMSDPQYRAQLYRLQEAGDAGVRAQFEDQIFGQDIQRTETEGSGIAPVFHAFLSEGGKVLFAATPGDPKLAKALVDVSWPADRVIDNAPFEPLYLWLNDRLYVAVGVRGAKTTPKKQPHHTTHHPPLFSFINN